MYFRSLAILFVLMTSFTLGCQGGKAENSQCDPNAPPPYNQCKQTAECPSGQTSINGRCQIPATGCDVGFIEVDGTCQPSSLECPAGEHLEDGACVIDQLAVTLVSQTACWMPETGAARVIVQYTARDEAGRNLATTTDTSNDSGLQARFFVNNQPMDVEAQLSSDSELLNSDLVVSLVLDASGSMLEHTPPAFTPMKNAAMDILRETQNAWAQTSSQFDWRLMWFDYALYTPMENMAGEPWTVDDIAHIPEPQQDANTAFTALYKAVNKMVGIHKDLYDSGVAAGPRDQHVMLIFSDGGDNQAHVDNPKLSEEQNLNNMLFWKKEGGAATDLAGVKNNVASAPNLRTFVIGFGSFFDGSHTQSLKDIASSGRGQYFFGADATNLNQLFRDVQTEFVTLQTLGAEVPLAPDTYTFSLLVKHPLSGSEGRKDFEIEAGPSLGECTDTVQ